MYKLVHPKMKIFFFFLHKSATNVFSSSVLFLISITELQPCSFQILHSTDQNCNLAFK